jgi:hypothetical protein
MSVRTILLALVILFAIYAGFELVKGLQCLVAERNELIMEIGRNM